MQIGVIQGGAVESFDHLLYPEHSERDREYFRDQVYRAFDGLTERGREFMARAKETFERYHDGSMVRKARQLLRSVKNIMKPNTVQYLETKEDIQQAPPAMQRYIMACPDIRKSFQKQRIDGYSGTYYDAYPGKIGINHYDWRRARNGMLEFVKDEETGEENFQFTTYLDELLEGDRELDLDEKNDIEYTWDNVLALKSKGIDGTDSSGEIKDQEEDSGES